MDHHTIAAQHQAFAGTAGISSHATEGFRPAFLDKATGRVELACHADGEPASFHLISWLPREWAANLNPDGTIESLKGGIICGFECEGVFYTRAEAAELDY